MIVLANMSVVLILMNGGNNLNLNVGLIDGSFLKDGLKLVTVDEVSVNIPNTPAGNIANALLNAKNILILP